MVGGIMKARKISLLLCALVCLSCLSFEVNAQSFFANTYGGSGYDYAYSIEQTADGGYIFCGPGTFSTAPPQWDFWIVKLDALGNVSWQKAYGGSSDDIPNSIKQTADGGYIVAGRTQSYGEGGLDAWVIKLDSSGNRAWQKTFGGTGSNDAAYCVVQNGDGDYYLAGWTDSYGVGGSIDYWIIKLNSAGNILWEKSIGGSGYDTPYSCCLASDGGIVTVGGGNVGAGGYDVWVVKLDSSGAIVWQKAFGGSADDMGLCIRRTSDDGFIVAGFTKSYGAGNQDFWVLKLDSSGNLVWNKTYGGSVVDWAFAVEQTIDGGYIVVGRTDSFGVGTDAWILKLNSTGGIEWQRRYGSSGFEYAYTVRQAADGSYMVGGITGSFGAGSYDAMILKLQYPCILGGPCSYLAATSVTPVTPSPTTTTTAKSLASTSCGTHTTAPTSVTPTASRNIQCSYPILPDVDSFTITVSKSGSAPMLNWNAPGGTCAVTGYGIYRGTLPISSYDHESLNCSVTDLYYVDSFAGDNQYYLVVPYNSYLEGSYGTDSYGNEIPAGSTTCKPRCLLPCL
jgi:hypothetical protein